MRATYKSSGVDISAGEELVRLIKPVARGTFSRNVLRDVGIFGSFYRMRKGRLASPVMVASTDGVGTKLAVAFAAKRHGTVGQDLVNHCVNDIAVSGAIPLFFLDYYATGKLVPRIAAEVIGGVAKACGENGVSLVGGETAEMPGLYQGTEYDLAGTIVGIVDEKEIIDGRSVRRGDILLAVPSNGLHTNGYSLARKVLLSNYRLGSRVPELGTTLVDELLKIHRSYLKPIRRVTLRFRVGGISHITGGGIEGNTKRILPKGLRLRVDWGSWERPAIFPLVQKLGNVPEADMRRTFNLGVGLIFIVRPSDAHQAAGLLRNEGAFVCGGVA